MKTLKILILSLFTMIVCNSVAQSSHHSGRYYAEEFVINQGSLATCEVIYFKPITEIIKTDISVLDSVSDTAVLEIFNRDIVSDLKFYGFDVRQVSQYPTDLKSNEHTLEISQIEMEEYTFYDSIIGEQNANLKFYKQLNGVRLNVWLTYNEQKKDEKTIFYNEEVITDNLDGYFEDETVKNPYINYEITGINPNDVYFITSENAKHSAQYFYNYLLNNYIALKTGNKEQEFYSITLQRSLITSKKAFNSFEIVEQ